MFVLRINKLLLATAALLGLAATTHADTIRLSFPPDPNALPVFVLHAKQAEWLPNDRLELSSNPAGDPSAMRALIAQGRIDFSLFNLVGGVRFVQSGLKNIHLVSPWVWKGVYLLTPADTQGRPTPVAALHGKTLAASPGLSTPPQIVTQKALERAGVRPDFISAGAGMVLMNLLSDPARAPSGLAAAEPAVSLVLWKQQQDHWPQQWAIALDPAESLGTEVPLGALWQVGDEVSPQARKRFVEAMQRVADWASDPRNRVEAARIASEGYAGFFRQPIPPQVFETMLSARRVVWRLDPPNVTRPIVKNYLDSVFDIEMPPSLYASN